MDRPLTVLYFGTFDPRYGRNRVLINGFRENGIEVVFCNGGTTGGIKKFLRLIWRYLLLYRKRFDMILIAFPAQEATVVAGLLLLYRRIRHKTPVLVDMLTSHYDGYILDRKKYSQDSWHALWYRWLDRTAIRIADCVLVESDQNGQFFVEELNASVYKFLTVPIGTDDSVMKPALPTFKKNTDKFIVHFHGKFIPHQGIGTIIKAANLLQKENILFQIIGHGQDYGIYRKMASNFGLTNINWIDSVPYELLPDFINKADVCLGPMGGTNHFHRCAPNKIYEYMACGRPIITGRSGALHGIAIDHVNMLLVEPTDENDLANKIIILKTDKSLVRKLSENARTDYLRSYTPLKLVSYFIEEIRRRRLLSNAKIEGGSILITGANGFIGSRLSSVLIGLGYSVIKYNGDINDMASMEDCFKHASIVIHLASKIDDARKGRKKDDFIIVNVLGTKNVVNLCIKYGCKLLFFSSATAAHPNSLYGLSKFLGEQLVQFHGSYYGLRATIIRPNNIYSDETIDRRGKRVDLSRGLNYPLLLLSRDVARIIRKDNFSKKVRIYETRLIWEHVIMYWPRRILNKFKRMI